MGRALRKQAVGMPNSRASTKGNWATSAKGHIHFPWPNNLFLAVYLKYILSKTWKHKVTEGRTIHNT